LNHPLAAPLVRLAAVAPRRYISPGWDRFFVLGGSSEGHHYSDWFNDQGQRFNASQRQYSELPQRPDFVHHFP
jgi:hypothetical protein